VSGHEAESGRASQRTRPGRLTWAVCGGVLAMLVGCQGAIVGEWHLVEAKPNRHVFSIDEAHFRPDGTFSASTTLEGVTTSDTGTYEFNGFKLKLWPRAGGQRTYQVQIQPGRLEITSGKNKAVLEKGRKGG